MLDEEYFETLGKLKYYENLEKQDRLLILPFKLGSTIYWIIGSKYNGKYVDGIEIKDALFSPNLINEKEIFATLEEAENRLKEILEYETISKSDIPNTKCYWINEDGCIIAPWNKEDYERGLYTNEVDDIKLYTLKKYELDYCGLKVPRYELIKEG